MDLKCQKRFPFLELIRILKIVCTNQKRSLRWLEKLMKNGKRSLHLNNIEFVEKKILKDHLQENITIVKKMECTNVYVMVMNYLILIQNLNLEQVGRVFLCQ